MANNLKIKRWIRTGHLNYKNLPVDTDELIDVAGCQLDSCESHEILGTLAFEAEDGQVYVMTVEAVIGKINPNYLKELQQENEDDGE